MALQYKTALDADGNMQEQSVIVVVRKRSSLATMDCYRSKYVLHYCAIRATYHVLVLAPSDQF